MSTPATTPTGYHACVSQPDEDGICMITIFQGAAVIERHYGIRCDQAHQWAAQEVECLNDPRTYGYDLPESESMDAEERHRHGYAA